MNYTTRYANVSKTMRSWSKTQAQAEWIVAVASSSQLSASVSRCHYCHLRRTGTGTGAPSYPRLKVKGRPALYSFQPLLPVISAGFASGPKENQPLVFADNENACPQGIQGDIEGDCTFNLWLENCRRYGLENCDQQLQGIQSGRKNLAQVMAEQEQLIADIAEGYRRHNAARRQVSFQGVQDNIDAPRLPDINTPCPQGIQGEDCARFKLWLENCHSFQFGNCQESLENYNKGHITLTQLFEQQDKIIREAAVATSQIHKGKEKQAEEEEQHSPPPAPAKPLTSAQKLKNAVAVYGSTVMVFHVSISLMSLGFFYTLVSSGIDVVGILSRLGIGETIVQSKLATGTGTFVVAYAVHKVFAPVRIAATLTSTPLIVRYLRRIGFLKTPTPKK